MRPTARRLVHGLLLAATVLALAPAAQAQYFGRNKVRYDTFDFQVLETEHFDIYYYEGMDQSVQDVARMAERWYDRLSTILDHQFEDRKSIVLYADDADFRQTNIANIGEGTQGVTEGARLRVVLPVASTYAATDHVLGHELVHQFQYDIARTSGRFAQFVRLPLFVIEGMAEYYSVGRRDALTAMWMRDAVLRDDFPTLDELQRSGRYNEYQYGQPFWAYVGGTYGDEAGVQLFRTALDMPLDSALVAVTGVRPDSISAQWERALRATLVPPAEGRSVPRPPRTPEELEDIAEERRERAEAFAEGERPGPPRYLAYPDSLPTIDATRLLARERETGGTNIAPQLSPDGRYVAFLSELDLFGIDLFLADAETGEVLTKLESVGTNTHFDAIRFIESAGTWSPDSRYFAYVVFAGGDNEIAVLDVENRDVVKRLTVEGIGAIKDPSWSPDGSTIVFAGVQGGISDLYAVGVGGADDGVVTQLTNDRYADIQPAWSPDGSQIAFVTDRGPETDFVRLTFSPVQIALYDVATGGVEVLDLFDDVKHINPAWSPDGQSLYFISDRAGFNDVYRYDVATGDRYQVTNLATGVAGIADLSPALSVADETGELAYSVFEAQRYSVYRTPAEEAVGTLVGDPPEEVVADVLPPVEAIGTSSIQAYLADATDGLPVAQTFPTRGYSPRLSLEYISQPQVGVGYDSFYNSGFGVAGGISFLFADQLSDNLVGVSVAANGTFKDIGGQALYLNRGRRLNYGAIVGQIPFLQVFYGAAPPEAGGYGTRLYYRTYVTQVGGLASYPLNQSQRIDANVGYRRYGFDLDYDAFRRGPSGFGVFEGRRSFEGFDPDPLHLAEAGASFVGDASFFGFVSPIRGYRYRLGVDGTFGSLDYATITADARRYQVVRVPGLPRRVPFTVAVRALHFGRYGGDADNFRLSPLFIGYGQYVRGYSFGSFEDNRAFGNFQERLYGNKLAVASAEVRVPFLGVPQLGLISFPYLPTELSLFADVGMAWGTIPTSRFQASAGADGPSFGRSFGDQRPIFSAGVSARVSVLGALVVEPYYAFPFSRWGDDGDLAAGRGVFGLNLTPGW
ncbi:BamA/TamA family outer membrane protein [Rubrivirga sp. S365]|uniref:BamA/TamA family outer membrane protein n=1 Tax=Rubrivirga sp. S365 TaxID=3076080 RepID=UPI0028C54BB1|nr:BamA/TamA family outer membrane protein [Rubrivirga sp. S365]MDT7856194.1 BamA/TamA family outer membrane protein [Rubrivirga sp. S365]